MFKSKIGRIFLVLLVIYVVWSAYINITKLYSKVDSDALIPCLFYLPPLGFLAAGLVLFKVLEWTIGLALVRKLFHRHKIYKK